VSSMSLRTTAAKLLEAEPEVGSGHFVKVRRRVIVSGTGSLHGSDGQSRNCRNP
jgi:hypothetical protein